MVPDEHAAAGPGDPHHLGEGRADRLRVGDVVQRRDGEDEVEAVVVEGQPVPAPATALTAGARSASTSSMPCEGSTPLIS